MLLWRPATRSADGHYELKLNTKAIVHHNGLVAWQPPATYKSACDIDVEYFPLDIQTCFLKLGSWTYAGYQVRPFDSSPNFLPVAVLGPLLLAGQHFFVHRSKRASIIRSGQRMPDDCSLSRAFKWLD